MNLTKSIYLSMAAVGMLAFTACSSDDDLPQDPDNGNGGEEASAQYVIAADDSENSYLLTTDVISEGSVSPQGGSAEQVIGTPSWYFYKDLAAYSFVYRQGDPGTTQSFSLDSNGELLARNEIDLQVSIQARGIVENKLYVGFSSRNYEEPVATFFTIDGETQVVEGPFTIDTEALAGNGEYAYISDVTGYKDNVLMSFRTIKAGEDGGDSAFNSDYNDHAYVAVFNQNLDLIKVIEDSGRTGIIAGQSRSQGETGVEPVDNGDVYVFSSALDNPDAPSGVLKINDGELEFDGDYFFDISQASGGHKLYRSFYAGGTTFVLQMFTEAGVSNATPATTRTKFAVVDVADQSFEWVSGVPEGIQSIGVPYIDKERSEVVFPIETNLYPTLYILDTQTATLNEGLEVVAEGIGAIGKLSPQE